MRSYRRSKKYQCYSLWFDPIGSRTHDLPHVVWHAARYHIHKIIKAIPHVRYTTCKPAYTIYLLQCSHCGIQYICELEQPFHNDEFENNKRVMRIRKSKKDRQHNVQRKMRKGQTKIYKKTMQKTKDRATRTPLKTGSEPRCFGRVWMECLWLIIFNLVVI